MTLDQLPQAEIEAVAHAVAVLEQAHGVVGESALPSWPIPICGPSSMPSSTRRAGRCRAPGRGRSDRALQQRVRR